MGLLTVCTYSVSVPKGTMARTPSLFFSSPRVDCHRYYSRDVIGDYDRDVIGDCGMDQRDCHAVAQDYADK